MGGGGGVSSPGSAAPVKVYTFKIFLNSAFVAGG